jgi:hypothetical protein
MNTNNSGAPQFIDAGWFISYMNYFATGEGVTSWIAVAGDASSSEELLKERLPDYFHSLIVTSSICSNMGDDAIRAMRSIPESVRDTLRKIPVGCGHFCTELHFNLA